MKAARADGRALANPIAIVVPVPASTRDVTHRLAIACSRASAQRASRRAKCRPVLPGAARRRSRSDEPIPSESRAAIWLEPAAMMSPRGSKPDNRPGLRETGTATRGASQDAACQLARAIPWRCTCFLYHEARTPSGWWRGSASARLAFPPRSPREWRRRAANDRAIVQELAKLALYVGAFFA